MSKVDKILDEVIASGRKIAAIEEHLKNINDKIIKQETRLKEHKILDRQFKEKCSAENSTRIDNIESNMDKFKGAVSSIAVIVAILSILVSLKMLGLV